MDETGVSLGGGCLRGAAHIGALKELVDQNISVTHIAGTSAGAVIGGLFACGLHPKQMIEALESISIRKHLDFSLNRKGWLKGDRIYNTLLQLTDGKYFSELDIPLAVVCLDLNSRKVTVIDQGEVATALRASIAIPGIFPPVEMGEKLLVDGYILNNNPANVVKDMGANHVTAIRVLSSNNQNRKPKSLLSFLNRYIDIASHTHTNHLLNRNADITMDIDLVDVGRFDPKALNSMIRQGQEEARKSLHKENSRLSSDRVIVYIEDWLKRSSS